MKPQELYNRKPETVDHDFNYLFGHNNNLLPEIDDFYGWVDCDKIENPRIEIKILKNFNFDGRRFWQLATVWFDDKPIMITRNAGREGDDHTSRFITDENSYKKMVEYIKTLMPVEFRKVDDVVDSDMDIHGLETFYGNTLDGYFERY